MHCNYNPAQHYSRLMKVYDIITEDVEMRIVQYMIAQFKPKHYQNAIRFEWP